MTWRPGRLALVGALFLAAPAAGEPRIELTLEPRTITVGDRIEGVLELAVDPGELAGEPRFPAWGTHWGALEVVEAGPVERLAPNRFLRSGDGSPVRFRQRFTLTAFRPGRIELPRRRVAVPGEAETRELWTPEDAAVTVASVLPEEAGGASVEPRPAAAPRPLPAGRAFWWTASTLALLTLGALVLAARRPRPATRATPAAAPFEELSRSLDALGRGLAETGPEEGHVRLSWALRRYLGRALGFPALERTTAEIRRELRRRKAPPELESRADELLRACDRVKFAREPVALATLEARLAAAREVAARLEEIHRTGPAGAPAAREAA